jgi:hypothetical protein
MGRRRGLWINRAGWTGGEDYGKVGQNKLEERFMEEWS